MQNLKIAFAFLCAILIACSPLSAQLDFKKGFIVTLEQDTVKGWIKDQTFEKLSRQIFFKPDKKAEPTVYLPLEISGFAFNDGDVFESFEIEYCSVQSKKERNDVKLVRFLNKIIDGEISLYELTDKEHPLFIKKSNTPLALLCLSEQLVTKVYDENGQALTPKSGKKYKDGQGGKLIEHQGKFFRIDLAYIDVLKNLMADCPAVMIPDDLPLSLKRISKLVLQYNKQCYPASYEKFMAGQQSSPVGRVTLFASLPVPYYEQFGGIGKGASIELGGKRFSANFLIEHVEGTKNASDFNYKIVTGSLRGNVHLFPGKRINPYLFAGASAVFASVAEGVDIPELDRRRFYKIEAGAGVNAMITSKVFLKTEIAYPHFPNVRFGIGMLLN